MSLLFVMAVVSGQSTRLKVEECWRGSRPLLSGGPKWWEHWNNFLRIPTTLYVTPLFGFFVGFLATSTYPLNFRNYMILSRQFRT